MKQSPISLIKRTKKDLRTQFAALCYRIRKGEAEVLLITSRSSGRWIIPKGWPMDGKTPGQSAKIEAWEEAGAKGKLHNVSLGLFSYIKSDPNGSDLPCVAMVYPLEVKSLADDFPEAGSRKRRWMRLDKAAAKVAEPELARIISRFDPNAL